MRRNMFPTTAVAAAGLLLAGSTAATRLYATSYAGTVTTLDLVKAGAGSRLDIVDSTTACGPFPSWLHLDYSKSFIYCLDEAWGGEAGAVTSLYAHRNGSLTPISSAEVVVGPVSIAEFGLGGSGLAIAAYAGAGLNVVRSSPRGELKVVQTETFTLDHPGTIPDRQEAPHPHQALLDPTGKFVLVPDLGADLVRVYQADTRTLRLTPVKPLAVAPGAGPRHGVFKKVLNKTYYYLVTELANTIIGYEVKYQRDNTLSFSELFTIPMHADNRPLVDTAAVAEIALTPDERFLIVSSRWEGQLTIPNFDRANQTKIVSDPLINFSIDNRTGALKKIQEFPAGGMGPRGFSINAEGNLLAVGLQGDGRVVVIKRDVRTGLLKNFVAAADVEGEVNHAIFYEDS
ncbi:Lactonase, 7-bladed beta-propeller-domain-containing protein [Poronia punctata]|nr:Lactonase, 7-bladed beta-propeller-domain-containing protein [Poronia punctata]